MRSVINNSLVGDPLQKFCKKSAVPGGQVIKYLLFVRFARITWVPVSSTGMTKT